MNPLDSLIPFIFDEKKAPSTRFIGVLAIILGALFIDNSLGFSYHYSTMNRMEEIGRATSLLKDSTIDSATRKQVLELRQEVLERKSLLANVRSILGSIKLGNKRNVRDTSRLQSRSHPDNVNKKPLQVLPRNNLWSHATSGGAFYLFALLLLVVSPFAQGNMTFVQRLLIGTFAAAAFVGIGMLFYYLLTFIPQLSSSTLVWNYIINFLLQGAIIWGLLAYARHVDQSMKKKKTLA
jgi:hypothetical protein